MALSSARLNDLSIDSRAWLKKMKQTFEFEPQNEEMLLQAARLLDRIHQARTAVEKDGSYFTDAHGVVRAHPALKLERDSQALFAQLVTKMKLPAEDMPALSASKHRPRRGMR